MVEVHQHEKKKEEQTIIPTDIGQRKKEQFIENLREGDVVNDFFAVKLKNPPRSYKKGVWFDFVGTDKSGEIRIKFWGGENKDRVKRLFDSFSTGDIVQVRTGIVELYEEQPQVSVNENTGGIRKCAPNEYDATDFIPALEEHRITELYEQIQKEIKGIKNEQLHLLLTQFFSDPAFVKQYTHAPSAVSHHHNYVGGNLEHTVGVIRLCENITGMYPSINKDLLIAGAILHDVGKLKEYSYKGAIDKTEQGNFIGHIVLGEHWIREKVQHLRESGKQFSPELETHLCHMILSHHGKYEWGSPRMPKIVEAVILHLADLMDSQVKNHLQMVQDAKKQMDEDWAFIYDSDFGKKRVIYLGDY